MSGPWEVGKTYFLGPDRQRGKRTHIPQMWDTFRTKFGGTGEDTFLTTFHNVLERLSLASLSSLV